jgi:twitching motility protein PilT
VLSTLHTIDAAQTITRIIDVFPPHQQEQVAVQLSMTLELIISQRLLPTADGKSKVAAREILFNTPAVANNIRQRKIPQIMSIMETGMKY